MENNTRIIRFSDGTMIVCIVEGVDDLRNQQFINILYPIEIYSNGLEDHGRPHLIEQYMLKAWIGLSGDLSYTLNTSDITVISTLKEEYITGYERVVNKLYFSKTTQDPQYGDYEEDEFTPEDLLELLQAKEEGKLN